VSATHSPSPNLIEAANVKEAHIAICRGNFTADCANYPDGIERFRGFGSLTDHFSRR
jgi:hypothetical protein